MLTRNLDFVLEAAYQALLKGMSVEWCSDDPVGHSMQFFHGFVKPGEDLYLVEDLHYHRHLKFENGARIHFTVPVHAGAAKMHTHMLILTTRCKDAKLLVELKQGAAQMDGMGPIIIEVTDGE